MRQFICAVLGISLASTLVFGTPAETTIRTATERVGTQTIAEGAPENWLSYGKDYHEQRYSALTQINDENVGKLGLAWAFDTDFNRGLEATPIVVDGVMFVSANWSVVHALDARTGKELWRFDPEVPREWAKMACCDVVNRGVAVYQGKVFFGTLDARLIALDAATGKKLWEVQAADTKEYPYTITGAPRVFKDKVVIGNGGAEYGVRGFVSAFDVNSGEEVWRFYTVPGNPADGFENEAMKQAAETWTGEWWKMGGGGTVWDSIVYDPELDQLYLGVGNGSPWNHKVRSPDGGDNLYLSSIVALDPDTGEYLWHYQQTPGESWDFTATQHIMLADMEWQGTQRKVIWQAPKNGFFFVIDRQSGELLSAEPYARVNWATHYDMSTGRPVETDRARYRNRAEFIRPSSMGAHNWHPMAYSPQTGLVYIPAIDALFKYGDVEQYLHKWGHWNLGVVLEQDAAPNHILAQLMLKQVTTGSLLAWDPKTQSAKWVVEYARPWNGGVLATAGNLVFQGTAEGEFRAYRADSGEQRWSFDAHTGVIAPPVTYSIDGEQYVTVLAGWGGAFGLISGYEQEGGIPPSRVLTFKLGGEAVLPENPEKTLFEAPEPPEVSAEELKAGRTLYHEYCSGCHGTDAVSNGAVPDLRHLPGVFYENFDKVVLDGMMRKAGMVGFGDVLDKEDSRLIKAYILTQAEEDRKIRETPSWWMKIKMMFFNAVANVLGWIMDKV
ncbi:PQQ-dependent dehydrogenase, methanol/ethanol family [Litorivivens sp.]|uniref:PQQ-dependent dehydrogenase, methanol/ethanol family n=1 Tax=Litorivivens sp. TaxID=2020868 RepID=UPI00356916E7